MSSRDADHPAPRRRKGLAVASLTLGILSLPTLGLVGFGALLSIILGVAALVKLRDHPEQYEGKGLAIAGIVCGAASVVLMPVVLGVGAAILIPTILRARVASKRARRDRPTPRLRRGRAEVCAAQPRFLRHAGLPIGAPAMPSASSLARRAARQGLARYEPGLSLLFLPRRGRGGRRQGRRDGLFVQSPELRCRGLSDHSKPDGRSHLLRRRARSLLHGNLERDGDHGGVMPRPLHVDRLALAAV